MDEHPWGGTVLDTTITQPVYDDVVFERFSFGILDMGNAMAVHMLDSVHQKIQSLAERLLNSETEAHFLNHEQAFTDYYLVNTLSSSLFEAASYLLLTEPLCYKQSDTGLQILSMFEEEGKHSWYKVEKATDPETKRLEALIRLRDKFNAGQYRRNLDKFFDVDDRLTTDSASLSERRGTAVHSLLDLVTVGWEDVKQTVSLWMDYVDEVIRTLHRELTIHEGLLSMMQD